MIKDSTGRFAADAERRKKKKKGLISDPIDFCTLM